jgi:hypothetical protein
LTLEIGLAYIPRGSGGARTDITVSQRLLDRQRRMASIQRLYRDAELAAEAFDSSAGLSCPEGCGICCGGFVSGVRPEEAHLSALYLGEDGAAERRDKLIGSLGAHDRPACPLYRAAGKHHCCVYTIRPLVCRLFAAPRPFEKKCYPLGGTGLSAGARRCSSRYPPKVLRLKISNTA